MFQYRSVLVRLRRGDSDRELARSKLMGRRKLGEFRDLAAAQGWLDAQSELPDDATILAALGATKRPASTISSLQPLRPIVEQWVEQGVQGTTILSALKRNHGYGGSYSSVYRLVRSILGERPPEATVPLLFAPAEAAQVDFGAGPVLADADGVLWRTWAFVMTLCFSRHQYVEFVWDQSVATWLGCLLKCCPFGMQFH
jgi:transposase